MRLVDAMATLTREGIEEYLRGWIRDGYMEDMGRHEVFFDANAPYHMYANIYSAIYDARDELDDLYVEDFVEERLYHWVAILDEQRIATEFRSEGYEIKDGEAVLIGIQSIKQPKLDVLETMDMFHKEIRYETGEHGESIIKETGDDIIQIITIGPANAGASCGKLSASKG